MDNSTIHPSPESAKKHGDPLESALDDTKPAPDEGSSPGPVPPADKEG